MTQCWEKLIFENQLEDISCWIEHQENPGKPPNELLGQEQRLAFSMQKPSIKPRGNSKRVKHEWTSSENVSLLHLHDELGNKWCQISKHFDKKSENDVKNHFFSQLRMSLRHLNKLVTKASEFKIKPMKAGIIYKIISTCQNRYKKDSRTPEEIVEICFKIKHGLLNFFDSPEEHQKELAVELAMDIKTFSLMICKNAKGKKSKSLDGENNLDHDQFLNEQDSFSISEVFDFSQNQRSGTIQGMEDVRMKVQVQVSEEMRDGDDFNTKRQQTCQLIEKPEICLLNPFQQINLQRENQEAFLCLDKEDSISCISFYLRNSEPRQLGCSL